MKTLKFIVFTAIAISTAHVIAAGDDNIDRTKTNHNSIFSQLDANRDGFIQKEEAIKNSDFRENFDDVDDNDDNKVSSEEFGEWEGGSND